MIDCIFVVFTNIIILAFIFLERISGLLYVIYIEISVSVGSVFENHLAVGPKSKFARHKGRSLQMSFTEGTSSIFANFIVFGNIIIVAVVFAELVRLLPFIFDIKVVVFIGTVFVNETSLRIKIVITGLCKNAARQNCLVKIAERIFDIHVVFGNKVICAVKRDQLVCVLLFAVEVKAAVCVGTIRDRA